MVDSVIAWSFYPRILTRQGRGWRNISNNQSVVLHSTSVNKNADPAIKWLSYYHIMQSRNRNYNAHETSAVEDFCLALLCGDVEFKVRNPYNLTHIPLFLLDIWPNNKSCQMYAGVVTIDSNRIRFSLKDWKSMMALKTLSTRVRDILSQTFRNPKKELTAGQKEWLDIWQQIFIDRKEKQDEKNYRR